MTVKKEHLDNKEKEAVIKQYEPLLSSLSNKYLPTLKQYGYSYEDIYQIATICFLDVFEKFDKYKNVTIGAFAKKCINNKFVSIYRHEKSKYKPKKKKSAEKKRNTFISVPEDFYGSLSGFERICLEKFAEGKKPAEIARELGKEPMQIYNCKARIKRKLTVK